MSHSQRVPGYRYMKIARRKIPDRLVDFSKRSSVNRMAAGSLFKHTLLNIFKQAVEPGVLQNFSTCAAIPSQKNFF